MEIILFGVPAIGIIVGVVQTAKAMGLPVALAPWLALVLSVVASGIALVSNLYPESSPFLEALVGAVLLWLAVTGAYEKGKDLVGANR